MRFSDISSCLRIVLEDKSGQIVRSLPMHMRVFNDEGRGGSDLNAHLEMSSSVRLDNKAIPMCSTRRAMNESHTV